MQLLSIQQVTDINKYFELNQRLRIDKINSEESEAVKRLNEILDRERKENERLKNSTTANKAKLSVQIEVLLKEVQSLEERKKEALKPIESRLEEVLQKEEQNRKTHSLLKEKSISLNNKEYELNDRLGLILDREQELDELSINLKNREIGIKNAEEEIKNQTSRLAEKWVTYHTSVHAFNENIKLREQQVQDAIRANEIVRESLDKRALEQKDLDRQIKDRYQTLERNIERVKKYGTST